MNMDKIKIAYFVTRLEYGGVETVILNYIKNLKDRDSFEFHVITQNINSSECVELFKQEGFIVHIVTHKRKSIIKNIIEINQILEKERFDIAHAHMNLTNFYVLILSIFHGTKVRISHAHSALITDNKLKTIYYKIMTFINKLCANKYIACGELVARFYFGTKLIQRGKVKIFRNAINIEQFKYNQVKRVSLRKKYKINDSEYVVGHIGRFMDVKNHDFLLDIFEDLSKIERDVRLMLVGEGELKSVIKQKVIEKKLQDKVIFVGNTNNPSDYYQAMDIFVLPSKYEGLPMVSIEAQCSDLPCIFSDTIDKHCKISNDVDFLSINDACDIWVKSILKYKNKIRNHDILRTIRNYGYDIIIESNKLSNYYFQCLNERRKSERDRKENVL